LEKFYTDEQIKNDKLANLMASVKDDPSEENMLNLLREAAVSRFIVPVEGEEGNYSFHAVSDSKGKVHMVVFSDSDIFSAAAKKGIIAGFEDILEVVTEDKMNLDGFVINPGHEEVLFGKDMLKMIAEQMHAADDTAKVGEPDHYPVRLHDMLEEFAVGEPSFQKVWVRLMRVNATGNLAWLFVVEDTGDENARQYLLDKLKNFIKPYVDGLDLVVVSSEEDFAKTVTSGVAPFFEREEK